MASSTENSNRKYIVEKKRCNTEEWSNPHGLGFSTYDLCYSISN